MDDVRNSDTIHLPSLQLTYIPSSEFGWGGCLWWSCPYGPSIFTMWW